ncbi:MAG: MSMEG_4193 family putative phosphomutase [Frankiaceae bacterium]|nr:MSMEG_4193 family putative phosphomutase [Frankiaceae bacterium]MBV9369912.1 MSMEG_4193 family putative phosphomutase [Frankiales bacterium]
MTTVLFVRHGITDANRSGVLAGWTPGVHLAEKGREQAAALAARLAEVPVAAIVSSPLDRCVETASALAAGRDGLAVETEDDLGECRYGDWTGQELKKLAKDPLWKVVQAHPSAATFPSGESLRDTQARAVAAVRQISERLGPDATWIAVSHGDVIKALLADALGMHLDLFQRIQVDPCSLSVVRYTTLRPFVVRMNDLGGSVDDLRPPAKKSRAKRPSSDAVVGGGAGTA